MDEKYTDEYFKEKLTPEQYKVCRKKRTERAFTGKYHDYKGEGMYKCVACGQPLFSSDTKFESGTGWPSFYDVASSDSVDLKEDNSFFMKRTEVVCKTCGSHLGHVFPDGPNPTGQTYCVNSLALDFEEKENNE